MSGVGEVLTVLGAAASISQLLALSLKTSQILSTFYNNIQDAPVDARRVHERLLNFQYGLKFLSRYLAGVEDDELFPPDLQVLFWSVLRNVENVTTRLHDEFFKDGQRDLRRKRDRIKFVIADRDTLTEYLLQLKDAEATLTFVTNMLNL
jgi:hypothetical protein